MDPLDLEKAFEADLARIEAEDGAALKLGGFAIEEGSLAENGMEEGATLDLHGEDLGSRVVGTWYCHYDDGSHSEECWDTETALTLNPDGTFAFHQADDYARWEDNQGWDIDSGCQSRAGIWAVTEPPPESEIENPIVQLITDRKSNSHESQAWYEACWHVADARRLSDEDLSLVREEYSKSYFYYGAYEICDAGDDVAPMWMHLKARYGPKLQLTHQGRKGEFERTRDGERAARSLFSKARARVFDW